MAACALLISAAALAEPRCSPVDYVQKMSACADNYRNVTWKKDPRLEVWDCEGPDFVDGGRTTCDCTFDDVQLAGDVWYVKWTNEGDEPCTNADAILDALPSGSSVPMCSVNHLGFEYAPCDEESLTQAIVSYWTDVCNDYEAYEPVPLFTLLKDVELLIVTERPEQPTNNYILLEETASMAILKEVGPGFADLTNFIGQELVAIDTEEFTKGMPYANLSDVYPRTLTFKIQLPPARVIPCDSQCDEGTYLAPPMSSCGYCAKGTHSIRGDIYTTWQNDTTPANFHLSCYSIPGSTKTDCTPWTNRGHLIDSGTQPTGTGKAIRSLFEIKARIVAQPSSVKIRFRMDLEPADRFEIHINGDVEARYEGATTGWQEVDIDIRNTLCSWKLLLNSSTAEDESGDPITYAEVCVYRNLFSPFKGSVHFPFARLRDAPGKPLVIADGDGCDPAQYPASVKGGLVMVYRDASKQCSFVSRALVAQEAGAAGLLVRDHMATGYPLRMLGPSDGISIPVVSVTAAEGDVIANTVSAHAGDVVGSVGRIQEEAGQALIQLLLSRPENAGVGSTKSGKVYVNEVAIDGTKTAATHCGECPGGTYGLGGIDMPEGCMPCPANTFSSVGSDTCARCPRGTVSSPGAVYCTLSETCQYAEDFVPEFGPCLVNEEGVAELSVTFVAEDCIVIEGEPVQPPADMTLRCGPGDVMDCMGPGKIRLSPTECEACPPGKVPTAAQDACVECSGDEIVVLSYNLSRGFDALNATLTPPLWATSCSENCGQTAGWEFYRTMLDSSASSAAFLETGLAAGRDRSNDISIQLTHTFLAAHEGSLSFDYRLASGALYEDLDRVNVFLTLYAVASVDNEGGQASAYSQRVYDSGNLLDGIDSGSVEEMTHSVSFDAGGLYRAVWTFQKQRTSQPVVFVMTGIVVVGASNGVGVACDACPAGYSCKRGVIALCPAGTYRAKSDAAGACLQCPKGTVSQGEGKSECVACPAGTVASTAASPKCVLPSSGAAGTCLFSPEEGEVFDLAPLNETRHVGAGVAADAFILNVCKSERSACGAESLACTTGRQGGAATSLGSSLSIDRSDGGLIIALSEGVACPADKFRTLGASITVVCNPSGNSLSTQGELTEVDRKDACHPNYNIVSAAGCPICNERHMKSYWTACVDGMQTQKVEWADCSGKPVDGVPKTRECGGSGGAPVGIIVGLVAVMICLTVLAVYFCCKNRSLEGKYQAIRMVAGDDDFDDDVDDVPPPADIVMTEQHDEDVDS
ncbi:hypothetical protein DIPPA_13664 [Diplonema papillatum]|nr:hypothetical protein DIPPA_13664 [Diplonema papillatum]